MGCHFLLQGIFLTQESNPGLLHCRQIFYQLSYKGSLKYTGDTHTHTGIKCFSCVQLFVTPWTGICQAPLSMGFPRQKYWSGLPFPFPGNLPDPGIEPTSPALAGRFFTTEPPGKPLQRREASRFYHKAFLLYPRKPPLPEQASVFTGTLVELCHLTPSGSL